MGGKLRSSLLEGSNKPAIRINRLLRNSLSSLSLSLPLFRPISSGHYEISGSGLFRQKRSYTEESDIGRQSSDNGQVCWVGNVGWPPDTLSADCTVSTIELLSLTCVFMYTTRVHILYARAMIERPLGKRVWLPLRNREAKLFSRLLHGLHFRKKGFRFGINVRFIDRRDSHIRVKRTRKSSR